MRRIFRTTMAGCVLLSLAAFASDKTASDADLVAATAQVHAHDRPIATAAATTAPTVEVAGGPVTYGEIDGDGITGYLARPVGAAKGLPGLVVIHEWWGLNDNIRQVTERLAGEGYVALAVDLYGGESATEPKAAMQLMRNLSQNSTTADENLRQAYAYLEDTAGSTRIGVIGWCMGGRWSLRTALLLPREIDAAVIYYGRPTTEEAELATLQMPVMGNFAADDPLIPVATVEEFETTLQRLGKTVDIKIYEGANHAFANPSGTAYNPEAAEDAWHRSLSFLQRYLTETGGG